jgi:CTP-dependent riboflavin kinase
MSKWASGVFFGAFIGIGGLVLWQKYNAQIMERLKIDPYPGVSGR